jgi:hypothetical protein
MGRDRDKCSRRSVNFLYCAQAIGLTGSSDRCCSNSGATTMCSRPLQAVIEQWAPPLDPARRTALAVRRASPARGRLPRFARTAGSRASDRAAPIARHGRVALVARRREDARGWPWPASLSRQASLGPSPVCRVAGAAAVVWHERWSPRRLLRLLPPSLRLTGGSAKRGRSWGGRRDRWHRQLRCSTGSPVSASRCSADSVGDP